MAEQTTYKRRRTGSEMIAQLRKDFGIPEEKTTKADAEREQRELAARHKRLEEAGTEENYVKLYNRDPWTDKWLGPGPEPPMPYLEDELGKKDQVTAIRERIEREEETWRKQYMPKTKSVILPEIKETKSIRKARKRRKKYEEQIKRQADYDLAWWFLERFCKPRFRNEIYAAFPDRFEDMVDYCCWYVREWISNMTWEKGDRNHSPQEAYAMLEVRIEEEREVVADIGGMKFRRLEIAERHRRYYDTDLRKNPIPDIPDAYWNEFSAWCKKHPLKKYRKKARRIGWGVSPIGLRRSEFLKKINKRNKGFRKNMMLHDPLTGASFVSEKKMQEAIRKRMAEYDKQRAQFVKMLDQMVAKGQISEDMAISWMGETEEAKKRVKKRYDDMKGRIKKARKADDKVRAHNEKVRKARGEWYKKFGEDLKKPFTIEVDGEEIRVEKLSDGCYKMDRDGSTSYAETLRGLLLDDA